jgi:hypothetical protein
MSCHKIIFGGLPFAFAGFYAYGKLKEEYNHFKDYKEFPKNENTHITDHPIKYVPENWFLERGECLPCYDSPCYYHYKKISNIKTA